MKSSRHCVRAAAGVRPPTTVGPLLHPTSHQISFFRFLICTDARRKQQFVVQTKAISKDDLLGTGKSWGSSLFLARASWGNFLCQVTRLASHRPRGGLVLGRSHLEIFVICKLS